MSHRIEQLNEQIRNELANLISRNLPMNDALITVCYVDCSPDLKQAKIVVSVMPANVTGTALKKLKKLSGFFNQSLAKKIKIRQIPRFHWIIDRTEEKASDLEKIFKQIEEENEKLGIKD
ncbi:MAG: 30S ribosome-binding factor RbfA [Patescibacteria group bacterium]